MKLFTSTSTRWALAMASALCLACGCKFEASDSTVKISEFLASNNNSLRDSDGETADWIELYNPGTSAVDLTDWCLTDDVDEPTKWRFPSTSIGPGQYLIVFASSNQSAGDMELHTGFSLKATPDFLALVRPNGHAVQKFAPYPEQTSDVSYGIGSDGVVGYLETPTPGAPNSPSLDKKKHKRPEQANADKSKGKGGDDN